METVERPRTCRRALFALVLAHVALGLSVYGALLSELHLPGSRLNAARSATGAEFAQASKEVRTAVAVVGYAVPFVLGVVAGFLGSRATRLLEHRPDDHFGHLAAVFAVMIGGLAAVVSGCMIFAVYGWPHVPAYLP